MPKCGLGIYLEFIDALVLLIGGRHIERALWGNVAAGGGGMRHAHQIRSSSDL